MKVRPATLDDSPALAAGMKRVTAEERWLATDAAVPIETLEERLRDAVATAGHSLLVLERNDEVIGALGLHPSGVEGVLALGMWILPEWRGRGGGRLLLEAALAARPPGVHKIELEVFPDNEAAIALYESAGFEREGLRRDHYRRPDGSLRSAVIMARLFGPDS